MRKRILLIFSLLAVAAASCSKPAEPVGVGDVCQKPKDTLVVVEGYLVLPNYMTTKTIYGKRDNKKTYELFLVSQPDAKGASVRTVVTGGERNGIRELPATGYSFKDLQIYTNEGSTVGAGNRLKVTGTVTAANDGKCDVVVTKIEAAAMTTGTNQGLIDRLYGLAATIMSSSR